MQRFSQPPRACLLRRGRPEPRHFPSRSQSDRRGLRAAGREGKAGAVTRSSNMSGGVKSEEFIDVRTLKQSRVGLDLLHRRKISREPVFRAEV